MQIDLNMLIFNSFPQNESFLMQFQNLKIYVCIKEEKTGKNTPDHLTFSYGLLRVYGCRLI